MPQLARGVVALTDPEPALPKPVGTADSAVAVEPRRAALSRDMGEGMMDTMLIDSVLLSEALGIADTVTAPELITVSDDSDRVTVLVDTFKPRLRPVTSKVDLDNAVDFSASDSMVIIRRDSAFMYGNSDVKYGDIELKAANIQMDLKDNNVYAIGVTDSLGDVEGKPVFTQAGTDYEAATMRYNFKSQKGFITNVVTEQGEGYLTGGTTKKANETDYYIANGKYTTCDEHDCPHFYVQLTKAKVRPGKNIVTGPAYMVVAGLPLPLAVPFGYFPFTDDYASGVIVPSFGDDYQRGYYLRDGGYYFAINDNVDLALTGEIYTKGSWGLSAR